MRYKIKQVKSKKEKIKALMLCLIITIFFVCLALSSFYGDGDLPEFVFEIHKKAPMSGSFLTYSIIFYHIIIFGFLARNTAVKFRNAGIYVWSEPYIAYSAGENGEHMPTDK